MADSFQSSSSSSSSTPTVINTPQSDWGLQLSKLLSILAQGQYSWAMDQYNNGKAITDGMIANFMQLSGQGAGLAQKLISQYNDQFAPLNAQYIAQANSYNSEARQRMEMGKAESGVNQAMTAAANAAKTQLQSFGLNPSDGRYQALLDIDRTQRAAAMAGAGQKAGLDTADRGRAMTEKAIQFGQNVPGMAVNATNSATQASTAGQNANLGQQNAGATLSQTAAPFFNASAAANKMPPVGQTSSSGQSSSGRSSSPDRDSNSGNNRQQGSGADHGTRPANPNDLGYANGNGGPGARNSALPMGGGAGGGAAITRLDPGPDGFGDTQQDDGDGWQGGTDWNDADFTGIGQGDTDWSDPDLTGIGQGDTDWTDPDLTGIGQGDTNWNDPDFTGIGQGDSGTTYGDNGADITQYADTSFDSGGGDDYAEGGPVPKSASPSHGRQTDDISARLNAGEYVMPKDVVAHRGPDYFRREIEKSRRERSGVAGGQRYNPPGGKLKPALNRAPTFVSG